ncbi:MAG: Uncharacterised protein [Cyanobium sp. ARS6]|nr:MAG: Uncharacterised protein [Cyanobium sp. ARS6]
MPERHIFQGSDDIAAQNPGQAADAFTADRVALVRHGRAAFLPLGKAFFHLEHISALQVADFSGEAVQ